MTNREYINLSKKDKEKIVLKAIQESNQDQLNLIKNQ